MPACGGGVLWGLWCKRRVICAHTGRCDPMMSHPTGESAIRSFRARASHTTVPRCRSGRAPGSMGLVRLSGRDQPGERRARTSVAFGCRIMGTGWNRLPIAAMADRIAASSVGQQHNAGSSYRSPRASAELMKVAVSRGHGFTHVPPILPESRKRLVRKPTKHDGALRKDRSTAHAPSCVVWPQRVDAVRITFFR